MSWKNQSIHRCCEQCLGIHYCLSKQIFLRNWSVEHCQNHISNKSLLFWVLYQTSGSCLSNILIWILSPHQFTIPKLIKPLSSTVCPSNNLGFFLLTTYNLRETRKFSWYRICSNNDLSLFSFRILPTFSEVLVSRPVSNSWISFGCTILNFSL